MSRYTVPFTRTTEEFTENFLTLKEGTRIVVLAHLLQSVDEYAVQVSARCWHEEVEVRRRWFRVEKETVLKYRVTLQIFSHGKEIHWQQDYGALSDLLPDGFVNELSCRINSHWLHVQLSQEPADPEIGDKFLTLTCADDV